MAESIVSFLLQNLSQLLAHEANLLSGMEDKVTSLHSELRMINAFLKYAERKKIINEILDEVINQIKDIAHESEDVIDTFIARVTKQRRRNIIGRIIHGANHAKMLHEVARKIEMLKNRINEIHSNKIKYDIEDSESTTTGEHTLRRELINKRRRAVEEDDVIGFFHNSNVVIQQLMKGGSHSRLTVVSIIGMGGLGKTTLARKIYNNNQVKNYFDCCAWGCVSNDYRPMDFLLSLLKCLSLIPEDRHCSSKKQMKKAKSQDVHKLSEDELKTKIRECLKGKKYLVVLDDIWKTQDWDEIRDIFPDDGIGSRILITSRLKAMASYTGCTAPYNLPFLSAEESWELFCKKVFQEEDCPSDLKPLGWKIAESCHGLPLSIVVLSGLLANKEKSLREWSKIMGHVNWYLTQEETQVNDIVLKLSYDSLPQRLKPCFLYFGLFPEDCEVLVRPLIQKWVAEGFIQHRGTRNAEDVAEDYLYELVDRSLIQVASSRSDGGVKTCRIHDLLHDLCLYEGEKDMFFEVCTDTNVLIQTRTKPRRLSVHCKTPSYVSSSNYDHSCTRSLFFFNEECYMFTKNHWKWLVKGFELVRVLDLGQGAWFGRSISCKLEALIHLRYLKLDSYTSNLIEVIPNSICNLWNLETLDLGSSRWRICVVFPSGMWKLKRLRHLQTASPLILNDFSGSDTKIMLNLQTLSNVALNKEAASLVEKGMFPNLKKLGLFINSKNKWEEQQFLQSLKHLTRLNTLKICVDCEEDNHFKYPSLFTLKADTFPSSITKITWSNIAGLSTDSMKTLANLTNLRILKLSGDSSFGWYNDSFDLNCFTGWFPQLQVFQMRNLGVQNWELANGAMPRLRRLVIIDCCHLVSLPNELWSLTALIQVQVLQPSKELSLMLQNLEMKDGCELIIIHPKQPN